MFENKHLETCKIEGLAYIVTIIGATTLAQSIAALHGEGDANKVKIYQMLFMSYPLDFTAIQSSFQLNALALN